MSRKIITILLCSSWVYLLHSQDLKYTIDSLAQSYLQDGSNKGIAIGIIQNSIPSMHYYGTKSSSSSHLVDKSTLFEIGSVTKLFTAYIFASLEQKGTLTKNSLLSNHLPNSLFSSQEWVKKVRLIDLITHTSGLPSFDSTKSLEEFEDYDENDPYRIFTNDFMLTQLKHINSLNEYGTLRYSNFGIGLLAMAMENVTDQTYRELLREHVLNKIGLQETFLSLCESHFFNTAVPHRNGEPQPLIQLADLESAGGLKMTLPNLVKFIQHHIDPPTENDEELINNLTRDQLENEDEQVGLGWGIFKKNDRTLNFHNGGTYGSSSLVVMDRKHKDAVIILTNSTNGQPLVSFAFEIFDQQN